MYLTAVRRKGPVFTRQAVSGACFDQDRLDCAYSSNMGSWFVQVSLIEHDSHQTLSDHISVTVIVVLEEEPSQGRRKGSYTKMDHTFLDNKDFKTSIQMEWDQAQADYGTADPRIRWEKSWKRIKRLFELERKRMKELAE